MPASNLATLRATSPAPAAVPTLPARRTLPRILALSTLGAGSNEEARIVTLLSAFDVEVFPFNRKTKLSAFRQLFARLRRREHDLVVMEGTGLAGGMGLLLSRFLGGTLTWSAAATRSAPGCPHGRVSWPPCSAATNACSAAAPRGSLAGPPTWPGGL